MSSTVIPVHHGGGWATEGGAEVAALLDRLKDSIATSARAYGAIPGVLLVVGAVPDVAELLDDGPDSMARRMVRDCAAIGQVEVCALAIGIAVAFRLRSRGAAATRCAAKLDEYLALRDGKVTVLVTMGARYALVRCLPQVIETAWGAAPGGVS